MKKLINVILVMILLGSANGAKAADWLNWSNFSKVTGMVREGSNIWVAGHGGVVKIDTATLQKTYYIKKAGQLPSLMVEDIAMDAMSGDIWIGTYDNGMVQVHNGQWTTYAYPSTVTLYHITMGANGTVWCATSGGLYKFANHTFTLTNSVMTSGIWDVKAFPNGKLLIASFRPFIYDPVLDTAVAVNTSVATYNMSYISIENDSSFFFTAQPQGISHMVDTTEYLIDDTLVLNGSADQIIQMKVINNSLTVLTQNSKLYQYNGSSWSLHSHNSDAEATVATYLYQDANGSLSLGGIYNGGIVRPLNGGADVSLKKFALVSNTIAAIHDKSSTELWVLAGNEIGVYNKGSHSFTQVYELPISIYNNYFNAGDIAIWNGNPVALTDSGLYQFDGSAWSLLTYPGLPGLTYMLSLAADSSGNLYIGTLAGMYVVNGTTVTAHLAANTPVFYNNDVIRKSFFDATRNLMWFGTSRGLVKLENGSFTLINGTNYPQLVNYSYINAIAQDPSGNMWFGTAYGGLVKYDGTSYTVDSVGSTTGNGTVQAIAFDGNTMYASDNVYGFWVRENGTWTNYNTANSDMTSNYVTGLYVDDLHDVWLTSLDYGAQNTFGIDIFNKTQITLSVKETNTGQMSIYPNPTTGTLYIKSENIRDGDQVTLTDALGRQVATYQVSGNEINISGISQGVYFLQMADQGVPSVRIVKE